MMKSHLGLKGALARVLAMSAFVVGVVGFMQPAEAGISTTKHNLGSGGGGSNKVDAAATDEICVFCHTPHGSATVTGAPLWNKRLETITYTMYPVTDSLDSGTPGQPQPISLACLSCHDGTQAMDNVLNAPGSGGYDATGGGAGGLGWNWGSSPRADANGVMEGVAALGTDLRNDHPIGIKYCGGGRGYGGGTTVSGTCADADFTAPTAATIGASQRMWVDTGSAGRQKTDMFLFNVSSNPTVECASCHDVHSTTATFLRIANTGSAVCLACHNK